jgi:hypothetical protein
MFGQANHGKTLYYRHSRLARARKCSHDPAPYVRADQLEDAVVRHLFETFGNPKAVERAIEEATPNLKKVQECRERMARLTSDLANVEQSRNTILTLIERESLTVEQAETKLGQLQEREDVLNGEVERMAATLDSVPTPEGIKSTAKAVVKHFI